MNGRGSFHLGELTPEKALQRLTIDPHLRLQTLIPEHTLPEGASHLVQWKAWHRPTVCQPQASPALPVPVVENSTAAYADVQGSWKKKTTPKGKHIYPQIKQLFLLYAGVTHLCV